MRWSLLAIAVACAFFANAIALADDPPRKAGDVIFEPASKNVADVGQVDFEFGTLFVPENRAEPSSRIIGVGFARFRAAPKSDAPPIFLLPGGPGSSYLPDLGPFGFRRPGLVKDVLRFRTVADVILVDQRGFSGRGEELKHRFVTPNEPLDQPASLERSTAAFADMAKSAVEAFGKKGVDLRGYTVLECADDVNDLRKALGYERITLLGGSFGSQWSFAIMRRHPDRVARALLSGVEPLDHGYDMPSHVMAAVQRIWWDAEQDPQLQPYLPPDGIMGAAREVLRQLEREPIRVPLKNAVDPETNATATITLGVEDFRRAAPLRSVEGPAFVLSAYHGQYEQWATAAQMMRRSRPAEFPLIAALIDTGLGVTPKRKFLLRTDPATAFLGQWNFDSYLATADTWPTADVGDEFRTEIVCPIPVVFVHGDWDTQTPIENTLQVAPFYPKSHVMIVERGGHGALNQVNQHLPKAMDSLIEFLKTGSMSNIPTRVSVPPPKFAVPSFAAPKK